MSDFGDIDAELLGMAGGDSDDEGDDIDQLDQTQITDHEPSSSQEAKQSVEKTDEPNSRRGVAQKVKAQGRRKRKQESEDDGSPSPGADSDAPGDYDGEADAPADEDDDAPLFPLDGKFYDASDRDRILDMNEIDREEILADRAHQALRRQQDQQLRRTLQQAEGRNKRKAADADLEDGNRRSTRPKSDKRTALDDYRRAREQKGAERNRLDTTRDRRDERSPTPASDRDADGESEVEWAEPSSESRRDEPPAELRDFERCRVGRSNFAKVCFYPGFEDVIKGCFARVSIGINRETGQNQYRMTLIKGFTEGKPYQMENTSGKHFTTDQYAIVAQGSAEKPWPFSACSDGKFSEGEFTRFVETLKKESMRVPSRKTLASKVEAIHGLLNQKFTEATLQMKFRAQRAMELKHDPFHVAKQKRKAISQRRAEAEGNGDQEEIDRCDAELEAMDNSTANGAVKAKPNPAKPTTQHERLAQLNQANRSRNAQEVRQALIAERKKLLKERQGLSDRKTAEVKAKVEANAHARGEKREAARKASMHDLFGEDTTDASRAGTPATGTDTPKKSAICTPQVSAVHAKGPIGALKKKNLDDDVIGSLDLGIDVEI